MKARRLVLATLLTACHPAPITVPAPSGGMVLCRDQSCGASNDAVDVTYLGVGGFMVTRGDHVLLTAPHFTNPSLYSVAPRFLLRAPKLESNRRLIDSLLPAQARQASAILIGHGHYDHMLDVPFIADSLATNAIVYGSPSVRNMLWGDHGLRPRLQAIGGDSVGSISHVGEWITTRDSAFRFMALASSHAPALRFGFFHYDYVRGTIPDTLTALPEHANEWKLGEPYAYLIDVLGQGGRTVFRIYYQDAASDAPLGLPPAHLDDHRIDLAILCVPNARDARPVSPDVLLDALRPRYVIAGHWESFFAPQTEGIHRGRVSDFGALEASIRAHAPEADWSAPRPMDRYRFRTDGQANRE